MSDGKDEVTTKVEEIDEKKPIGETEETKEIEDTKEIEEKPTYDNGILKTSRQADPYDVKKNSKYDPSVLPETDDAKEIRKQVEFYFSDSNLPTDKYMLELTEGPLNLPVSIENLLKFGRMKRFKPASAIVAALRDSAHLEVSGAEGQESVKRKVPFDPASRPKAESRSVYVKGFGDEEPSSQFDIEAFFAPYGPTNSVRLRRTDEKLFKGSVFVEFDNDETAEKFLALDPKPLWKGKHELLITSKREYVEKKNEEIRDGKTKPKESYVSRGGRGGRGGGRGRGFRGDDRRDRDNRGGRDRGDRDPDDWKKRRDDDRANGFKHDKNRRDNNRDHKPRGRGGRRDDRGGRNNDRNNDRNREREGKTEPEAEIKKETTAPENHVKTETTTPEKAVKTEAAATPEKNDKKRAREDDVAGEDRSAKKVDTKSEVTAEAS